ncbi:phage terminase small subunit [Streptomyces sp. NPDC002644]
MDFRECAGLEVIRMGSRGPAPKDNAVRRNNHEYASEISSDSRPGRALPNHLKGLCAGAKRFWSKWSEAPQTEGWLETDWLELESTTLLVDVLYKGETKVAGEIRQRVAKWGATAEDRARLRMKIEAPKTEEGPEEAPEIPSDVEMDQALYDMLNGS